MDLSSTNIPDPTWTKLVKFVVEFADESEARKCLEKISQHGKVIHDFKKMLVGPTLARAKDKFGVNWEIVIC